MEKTPPQTAHKAGAAGAGAVIGGALGTVLAGYLGIEGELAGAVVTAGGAIGGAIGAYVKRNYLKR